MTKHEFLDKLRQSISEYPSEETNQSLEYYSEMIDDRVEEGMTEAEAVASLGTVETIAQQIKEELPLTTLVKQKTREKTKGKAMPVWAIVLLILGFPLWGSVVLMIVGTVLSLYLTIWAIDVSLWTVVLAFVSVGVVGIFWSVVSLFQGIPGAALFLLGIGLAGIGLAIFLCLGTILVTKGICHGTGWCFRQIKKSMIG